MRVNRWGLMVAAVLISAAAWPAAVSQTTVINTVGDPGMSVPQQTDQPQRPKRPAYSLTEVSTRIQTLVDGSQIRVRTETHRMVSSDGLQRTEMTSDSRMENQEPTVRIFDPKTNTNITLYPKHKVARVDHNSQFNTEEERELMEALHPAEERQQQARQNNNNSMEKLGTQKIAGLEANGTRNTQIVPAAERGNDREERITYETWFSKDPVPMIVRSIRDDPFTGHFEMQVTEINFAEPDPALFKVPDDYRVFDIKR